MINTHCLVINAFLTLSALS